jgi:hypothetical protein
MESKAHGTERVKYAALQMPPSKIPENCQFGQKSIVLLKDFPLEVLYKIQIHLFSKFTTSTNRI